MPASEASDTSPGWVYDASSGVCLGPASYELAEAFKANGERPMTVSYCGYPQKVVIRQRYDYFECGMVLRFSTKDGLPQK